MNARFWVYVNGGPVKLTLRPGEVLEHYQCWTTDEGWSSEYCRWGWDCEDEDHGGELFREWESCGRDCDGRLDRSGVDVCDMEDMQREWPGGLDDMSDEERAAWRGVRWPRWRECKPVAVYDEFAAAAGY